MIEDKSIEYLKNQLDVVDVISHYIDLKKHGANYKANCPFHDEKTPSFTISPLKNIYHCFGCGASGDSIKFVMEYEHTSYPEAIEKLASIYNIELKYSTNESKDRIKKDQNYLESINNFFKKNILLNINALHYIEKRGVSHSSIERFEIGYAPSSNVTLDFANREFLNISDGLELGVFAKGEGGIYSRFIDRVTFPIHNSYGKIVGFGGRTITDHPAKYINSAQSKVFNKSQLLYGYHLAKDTIFKKNIVIVTEGYLDVVMLHQVGFNNSIATLGTALTTEHIRILKKGEPKVILAYDGDSAGREAAFKGCKLLLGSKLRGGVVLFGEGVDPAMMAEQNRVSELKALFENAKSAIVYIVEHIISNYNLKDVDSKELCAKELKAFFQTLSEIQQEEYVDFISNSIKVNKSFFTKKYKKLENSDLQNIQNRRDSAEEELIFSMLQNRNFIDLFLEYADVEMFQVYKDEIELLKLGDFENPTFIKFYDVQKDSLDESRFKRQLSSFLYKYYERVAKEVANDEKRENRGFIIKKINYFLLPKLKKGELVEYQSFESL